MQMITGTGKHAVWHDLKVWPMFYEPLAKGIKTFELRKNDRDFSVGDRLVLREWEPSTDGSSTGTYTGRAVVRRVTYVLPGGQFGLPADMVIMSLVHDEPFTTF